MRVLCLPEYLVEQMRTHVTACLPEEGCGLLAGRSNQAHLCIPVTNSAHSPTRFYMDPFEQLRAMKLIDSQGQELVAIFHSHPTGLAEPSATDLDEFAYPGVVSLIWSKNSSEWRLSGYWIENSKVEPVEIIVERNPADPKGFTGRLED